MWPSDTLFKKTTALNQLNESKMAGMKLKDEMASLQKEKDTFQKEYNPFKTT
jgi:hypothetical protein